MNSELQNRIETGSRSISLLPQTSIQTKYHFRWRLGFIPQWKKKTVIVIYQVNKGKLEVAFEKMDGVRFIDKQSAEKWFYGPIEISSHVDKRVVTSECEVHCHVFCKRCGVRHFTDIKNFIGTEDMFGNDPLSIEYKEGCSTCSSDHMVEIHEKSS